MIIKNPENELAEAIAIFLKFFSYFKKENKEMSEKRCYTVQELQEILGVSRSTIYNRC